MTNSKKKKEKKIPSRQIVINIKKNQLYFKFIHRINCFLGDYTFPLKMLCYHREHVCAPGDVDSQGHCLLEYQVTFLMEDVVLRCVWSRGVWV